LIAPTDEDNTRMTTISLPYHWARSIAPRRARLERCYNMDKRPDTPATTPTHLTHLDESGNIHMVDVTEQRETTREAVAKARVRMKPETARLIETNAVAKGSVLEVAKIAGIMAAKQTPQLIPLCHPLPMTHIDLLFTLESEQGLIFIEGRTRTYYKTGVDVEALTAVTVAALTIYDMCKGVDTTITLEQAYIASKSGGKSGTVTFQP
jgi:cyclic pyranopterin phosphate synthase